MNSFSKMLLITLFIVFIRLQSIFGILGGVAVKKNFKHQASVQGVKVENKEDSRGDCNDYKYYDSWWTPNWLTNFGIWEQSIKLGSKNERHSHFCGGSIVHEEFILTAKHCVFYEEKGEFKNLSVVVGIYRLTDVDDSRRYCVKRIITNPSYDIALLQLTRKIDFINNNANAVELSPDLFNATEEMVVVG